MRWTAFDQLSRGKARAVHNHVLAGERACAGSRRARWRGARTIWRERVLPHRSARLVVASHVPARSSLLWSHITRSRSARPAEGMSGQNRRRWALMAPLEAVRHIQTREATGRVWAPGSFSSAGRSWSCRCRLFSFRSAWPQFQPKINFLGQELKQMSAETLRVKRIILQPTDSHHKITINNKIQAPISLSDLVGLGLTLFYEMLLA
jgi:hypothetical protein